MSEPDDIEDIEEKQEAIYKEWCELYFGLPSEQKTYSKWLEIELINARERIKLNE